jgi:hypothetical protein
MSKKEKEKEKEKKEGSFLWTKMVHCKFLIVWSDIDTIFNL